MLPWYKQKTTWTAITGLCTALGAYATGDLSLSALIAAGFAAVSTIFLRQGVNKSGG